MLQKIYLTQLSGINIHTYIGCLDESTDVHQLLLFIWGTDKNYEMYEELLDIQSMHGTTTEDIFTGIENAVQKKKLQWKNLKGIATDGSKDVWKGIRVLLL